jgi:hypothetical protein
VKILSALVLRFQQMLNARPRQCGEEVQDACPSLEGHLGLRNGAIFPVRKFVPLMSEQSIAFRLWGFFVTQYVRQRIGAWCYRTQCLETCVCATRRVSEKTMVIFCSCRPGQKMEINRAFRSGKGLSEAWFGRRLRLHFAGTTHFQSPRPLFPFSPFMFWPWKLLFLDTQFSRASRRA